jgi:hypothetical protein
MLPRIFFAQIVGVVTRCSVEARVGNLVKIKADGLGGIIAAVIIVFAVLYLRSMHG